MEIVYNLLAMFLGQPPDVINWSTSLLAVQLKVAIYPI